MFPAFADGEQESFLLAENAYEQGLFDTSYKLLESFVDHYPESKYMDRVKSYMARSLFYDNRTSPAREFFVQMLGNKEVYYQQEALYYLALIYSGAGDASKAEEYFVKAVSEEYKNLPYYYKAMSGRARNYVNSGDTARAIEMFEMILSLSKDRELNTGIYKEYAQLCILKNDAVRLGNILDRWENDQNALDDPVMFFYFRARLAQQRGETDIMVSFYSRSLMFSVSARTSDWIISELLLSAKRTGRNEVLLTYMPKLVIHENRLYIDMMLAWIDKDFEDAQVSAEEFLKTVQNGPRFREAQIVLADCLYHLDRTQDALRLYQTYFSTVSNDVELDALARYGLGLCHLKMKKFEKAVAEFQNLPETQRSRELRASSFLYAASGNYESGRVSQAAQIYRDILDDFPQSEYADFALLKIIQIEIEQKRFSSAIEYSEIFSRDYGDSALMDENLYYRAYAYFANGEYELSKETLLSFESMFPESSRLSAAAALLLRVYAQLKEVDAGSDLIHVYSTRVMGSDRDSFYKEMIFFYMQTGQYKEASALINVMLDTSSGEKERPELIYYLAGTEYASGNTQKAEELYESFLSDFPEHELIPQARKGLVELYTASERFVEAEEILVALLDDTRQSGAVLDALDELCRIYIIRKDFVLADRAIDRVLLRFPQYTVDLTVKKAQVAMRSGKFDAAERLFLTAIDNGAQGDRLYYDYAFCVEKSGDLKRALEKYKDSVITHPQSKTYIVKSYLRMAAIYLRLQDRTNAAGIYEKIIGLGVPEASYAREQLSKILSK